jgi:hypothetical protein
MKEFKFNLTNGKTVTIKAEYKEVIQDKINDADGVKISVGTEKVIKAKMTAYVDGKAVDYSVNPDAWVLIDYKRYKKIWGMKIAFANAADAARFEKFVAEVIAEGKIKEEEKDELKEEKRAWAKTIVAKAEAQDDIPTAVAARARRRNYNDKMNEGGEGYVPEIIDKKQYDTAKKILKGEM